MLWDRSDAGLMTNQDGRIIVGARRVQGGRREVESLNVGASVTGVSSMSDAVGGSCGG